MRIAWIGAGNLATRLGLALKEAGHEAVQVYSRTMESASALAGLLGCPATNDVGRVDLTAEVYVFSVKDSVLERLVGEIAPRVGRALCLHTSGSMPADVFCGQAVRYGVLYPMQTFSRLQEVRFKEIPCFIEASDAETLRTVRAMALSVSDRVEEMSSSRRAYLHVAAVFACNFVNHCYALSAELLERQGIPFDVMLPLVDETARKVHRLSPHEAQTGPAVRYDENVIGRHLQMLEGEDDMREIYEMMSKSIHRSARNDK